MKIISKTRLSIVELCAIVRRYFPWFTPRHKPATRSREDIMAEEFRKQREEAQKLPKTITPHCAYRKPRRKF